ncbi:hypothetical protein T12_10720 [Trichinella patagoniensis]|uniref:Uncharacterized protein n=1 Tax=Trichinella patagoniensis TaxID=990121 RepID=A0A0V1A9Y4_9BILA|nr:hypothetical protein T12_10720 [Trichinella patagoniensis]
MEKKEDKWRKPRSVKGCGQVGSNRLLVNCVRWSIPFVGQVRPTANLPILSLEPISAFPVSSRCKRRWYILMAFYSGCMLPSIYPWSTARVYFKGMPLDI